MKTAADILAGKKKRMICTKASATIFRALSIMNERKVGAILLTDESEDKIVGIWTERDLMRNSMMDSFNPKTATVGDYMTRDLHSVPSKATVSELKEMILSHFIRHILIEENDRYVGILSVGDVIRASLVAQDAHIEELKSHTSWHYYERWGWEA